MQNKNYYLELIKNRDYEFLDNDIDFSNYSENFLKFYCSFMIWSMGHSRLENDYNLLYELNESEKLIAQKLIERNLKNGILIEGLLPTLY